MPSLLSPLISLLLHHLHPPPASPVLPYPPSFLPSLFLPLTSSILSSFINSLLDHLTFRLISPHGIPLLPDKPDERIKRATEILKHIIGTATIDGEALEIVTRGVTDDKMVGGMQQVHEHARVRVIVAWIAEEGDQGERYI